MASIMHVFWNALFVSAVASAAVTFTVPSKSGEGGYNFAPVDSAPVGISFEFFAFPSYFTNVTATSPCLAHWRDLLPGGTWPPIRIGGTTQDRALYDAASTAYVSYSVADPRDAPLDLTYGPRFLELAGTYGGSVVVGLNRGRNQLANTVEAAKRAVVEVGDRLLAIELGNEPEYYDRSPVQPIAQSGWSPEIDGASQNNWDVAVGQAIGKEGMIQAGNFNDSPPKWGLTQLIAKQNSTARGYVATYAHHNYPGGSVQQLLSHSGTASDVRSKFEADVAAVLSEGKPYVLGETNSVSGGGAAGVSPTYGAALWTMDYVLRAVYTGISRIYFHHGTVGNCQYCFWGRYSMGAPYYGATAATAFLAGSQTMTALDDGSGAYAAYVSFDASGAPLRALLLNSDYFGGSGSRGTQSFALRGLAVAGGTPLKAKRLTAPSATSRQDQGEMPTWGGQTYADGTCEVQGVEMFEDVVVDGGSGEASVSVGAAEAVVVYLQ